MKALMVLVLLTTSAAADPIADAMHTYYEGEREGGTLFLGTGLAATLTGGALHAFDDERARGASYALFAVAAIEIAAGATLLALSPSRARKLDAQLAADRKLTLDREFAHMKRVDKQFIVVEVIEALIGIGAAATFGVGFDRGDDALIGVGAGLFAQSVAMLLLDIASHRRALDYKRALAAATP